jgi:hypothetical protein
MPAKAKMVPNQTAARATTTSKRGDQANRIRVKRQAHTTATTLHGMNAPVHHAVPTRTSHEDMAMEMPHQRHSSPTVSLNTRELAIPCISDHITFVLCSAAAGPKALGMGHGHRLRETPSPHEAPESPLHNPDNFLVPPRTKTQNAHQHAMNVGHAGQSINDDDVYCQKRRENA